MKSCRISQRFALGAKEAHSEAVRVSSVNRKGEILWIVRKEGSSKKGSRETRPCSHREDGT